MAVQTLKEAWLMGWRVRVKCNVRDHWKEQYRDKTLSCHSAHELDLKTLVWTRGAMPIKELADRLRCPACGSRHILVYFEIPNEPAAVAAKNKINMEDYSENPDIGTWDVSSSQQQC
jgi:hypothetical protein